LPENGPAREGASFEEEFAVVERAVHLLEEGNLTLEESLREYETGLRSLGRCHEILRGAEKRIEILSGEVGAASWKEAATVEVVREVIVEVEREGDLPGEDGNQPPPGGKGRGCPEG
jgi:exodeoxyribonuclease VII small subunit